MLFAAAENDPELLSPQSFLQGSNALKLSTETDDLLFSTKIFSLEEALQKSEADEPLWSFQQDLSSMKEFETKGREKLFRREELFESRVLIAELIRNAVEASNKNEEAGPNSVNFELLCFPEVSVIRITQSISENQDWEKLKKNHIRFMENMSYLNRMERHGDFSLMTHQGVGLDRVGELLQNTQHPGLVRYLRGFESPNALITELYIKSAYSLRRREDTKISEASA